MNISFLVNEVAGGWEPDDKRLGGTEESIIRWAEEFVRRGNQVRVYYNGRNGEAKRIKDVLWQPDRSTYFRKKEIGFLSDITINIKSSEVPPMEPTLYLTNETNASDLDLSQYDGVIWPSKWAADNIPVNNPRKFILPHGYDSRRIRPGKKIPKQCFYASSPDRGLSMLLEAWPYVHAAHPDATLILTYGVTGIDLPGVICLGEADEDTMDEIFATSDIWCHPASGGELYCMTGIKAQAAGCVPVIIPTMALSETVRHGFRAENQDGYEETLKIALNHPELREECRRDMAKETYPDWEASTDKLEEIIKSVILN